MDAVPYSIRPARKSECRRIAEFYRISSDGVADYVWTKLARPGEDILDVGRRRYERYGYAERMRRPVVPHPLIHYTGDAILMVKELVSGVGAVH